MDDFLNLITCICINLSNYDAAYKVEQVLETPGNLMNIFNKNRFGYFNKSTFLERSFNSTLLFQLFYPDPNQLFIEHMMGLHKENQSLLILIAEQYHAQQVWKSYFKFAQDYHIITYETVAKLQNMVKNKTMENCLTRNKLFLNQFIPNKNPNILLKLSSVFTFILPKDINVDIVKGDGNCFFSSISNQFSHLIEDENLISNKTIRLNILHYCKENFDEFVESAVSIWKLMFESDNKNTEWAFFKPYANMEDQREIAKKMIRDELFLKPSFFAESFTMALTVEYLNFLFKRKLMIIVIDIDNEPFPVLGHTSLGSENIYTFLLKEPLHYSSISIRDKRVFTKKTIPKLNFKFLSHLEES